MNMTFSQSQNTSRVGSALNSRIGSTKGTPKGNKMMHPAHRLDKSPNLDTPAHTKMMIEQSRTIYDNLRKQSQNARMNAQNQLLKSSVNQPANDQFKMPMAAPRVNNQPMRPSPKGQMIRP